MTTNAKSAVAPVSSVARINVTPIIDVALVLVIILLITAPMLSVTDASLDLPSSSAQADGSETRIFVTLGRDGVLGVDDQIVAEAGLEAAIADKVADAGKNPIVVIRADHAATHGQVRSLLDAARAAGAPRIAVATRPEGVR
jgi:biopolymer transport protein ExbD